MSVMTSRDAPARASDDGDGCAAARAGDDTRALYRVMRWGFWSNLPVTGLLVYVSLTASSSAVLIMMLQAVVDVIVQLFELYALRQVIARDAEEFPYGAGKLENFAAFVWSVLTVPAAVYVLYGAGLDLARPSGVVLDLTLVGVAVSATRLTVLWAALRRLMRRVSRPSPVLASYKADTVIDACSNYGVMLALVAGGVLVEVGLPGLGDRADPAIAALIGVYQLVVGASILWANFRSLMDLPLPVVDQLGLMRVLAARHREFGDIGVVYTRQSGAERQVEVELSFAGDVSLVQAGTVAARLRDDLVALWGEGVRFRLAPGPPCRHLAEDVRQPGRRR